MTKFPKIKVGRRKFLSGVAIGAAAAPLGTVSSSAATASPEKQAAPTALQVAAEASSPGDSQYYIDGPGSDFMVDVIKSLRIEYVPSLAGSTFRGLHESLINYGQNKAPEFLTCLHEEVAVGIAHGYAKVAARPMAPLLHGTVGVQHASMAVYNAWCDRVPMLMLVGNVGDATQRRPGVEWIHSMQNSTLMLRDCLKWDDEPNSLGHFAESMVRGYRITMTPPMGPVLVVADGDLQEHAAHKPLPTIPKLSQPAPAQGEKRALEEAARLLVDAQNPVIVADRAVRTEKGMSDLVTLAELVGAAVIDKYGRLNIPSDHELNLTEQSAAVLRSADVVLGIEVGDLWGSVNAFRDVAHRDSRRILGENAKLISLGMTDLSARANYQDFQRYVETNLAIVGDGEASLPLLIECVRAVAGFRGKANAIVSRRAAIRQRHTDMRAAARRDAAYGWDASPLATARLYGELWKLINTDDFALLTDANFQSQWPHRLWSFTKPYQFIGGSGAYGVGYYPPAAVGAALAHKPFGRLPVAVIGDGEMMCAPTALWTAAHHRIPLLIIVHNNRSYHQEVMHIQRMAGQRRRGIDRAYIGNAIDDPAIDFAKLGQSMGVESFGPVSAPEDYIAALKKAIPLVKQGQPVLIDAVCQPR